MSSYTYNNHMYDIAQDKCKSICKDVATAPDMEEAQEATEETN